MYRRVVRLVLCLPLVFLAACGSESNPTVISDENPLSPPTLPDDAGTRDLATAIQGAWAGECLDYPDANLSDREVLAITDSQIIRDFYEYDGFGCQGIPRGKTFPLRIYNFELGSDVAAVDGNIAAQIDLSISQVPQVGYLTDTPVLGEARFDIIGVAADGTLLRSGQEATDEAERPTTLANAVRFTARSPLTVSALSIQDFFGSYTTGCTIRSDGNSSSVTETISDIGLVSVEQFHGNAVCSGEPAAATRRLTEIVWGDQFVTVFGDTMRKTLSTQYPKTILYGDEALGSLDLGEERVRYDAMTLVADTLFRGDCVLRVDDCKRDEGHYSDMIDLELDSSVRYTRVP